MPDPVHKERDWIDIGLKASTPLIVGLVVAWIGIYGDETLNTISHRQQSARLITELQIRREQDESALRKDIFTRALDAFLVNGKPAGGNEKTSHEEMSKQLLRLELLALNFGDSLSLTPLFVEMHKDLRFLHDRAIRDRDKALGSLHEKTLLYREKAPALAEKEIYEKYEDERRQWDLMIKRLTSLAKRVASSQASALALHGLETPVTIPLDAFLPLETYGAEFEKIDCDTRASQGSDRLSSNSNRLDDKDPLDLRFTWPYDEAWLVGKRVIAEQLMFPIMDMGEAIREELTELEKSKTIISQKLHKRFNPRYSSGMSSDKLNNLEDDLKVATQRYELLKKLHEDLSPFEDYIITYMGDDLRDKEETMDDVYVKVREIYLQVKQVVDPPMENENIPLDNPEFIQHWNSLKTKFGDGGFFSFWSNVGPFFGKDNVSLVDLGEKAFSDTEERLSKLEFQGVWRKVNIEVSEVDYCLQSLRIELELVEKKYEKSGVIDGEDKVTSSFQLDYFNFPTVDNTRLAHNHRFAVVIEKFDTDPDSALGPHIRLALLVFPSEYASLRDRPGMEEVRSLLESAMDFEPGGN